MEKQETTKHAHSHHSPSENTRKEYLKFAGVIILILAVTGWLYNSGEFTRLLDGIRLFMGVFMVTFAGFKLWGYSMFVEMFPGYDPIAKRFKQYAYAYPFIEFYLGVSALAAIAPIPRYIAVIVLMGIGAYGIYQETIKKKRKIKCACLGNVIKLPLSTVSLIEDVLMVALAIVMLLFY